MSGASRREPAKAGGSLPGGARRWLDRLEAAVARRLPEWTRRGPEDPARVLLETLALAVAELEGDVRALPDRLLPLLLRELGEGLAWPEPARGAVALSPRPGLEEAVPLPAATGVVARRSTRRAGEPPGARVRFETAARGWITPARLVKAVACDAERTVDLPVRDPRSREGDGGAEPGEASGRPITLFDRTELDRHAYLADPAWLALRRRRAEVVIEWPGVPTFVGEGRWEYSVRGGWRLLPVETSIAVDHRGQRVLQLRVAGPLPDLAERVIEGAHFAWFRLRLPDDRRAQWSPPRLVWSPPGGAGGEEEEEGPPGLPRPVARVLARAAGAWLDHSFAEESRVIAPRPAGVAQPAVWLGWDRPLPASLYWHTGAARRGAEDASPARLWWEYSGPRKFEPATVSDSTAGFSRTGTIEWGIFEQWTARERFGEELWWLRARWVGGGFLDPPLVRDLWPGAVGVIEGTTLRDVRVELRFEPRAAWATLPLLGAGEIEPFDRLELFVPGGAALRMRRVETFPRRQDEFALRRMGPAEVRVELAARPGDRVEARIESVRTGLGSLREGARASLDGVEAEPDGLERVAAVLEPGAGAPAEDRGVAARRLFAQWRTGGRAVTEDDYRRIVPALDPAIRRVEVERDPDRPDRVVVVVFPEPPCEPGRVSPGRLERLRSILAGRIPLGTRLLVTEPSYVPARVTIAREPGVPPLSDEESSRVETALRRFADPLRGGERGAGFPLGEPLPPRALEAIIATALPARTRRGERLRVHVQCAGGAPGGEPGGASAGSGLEIPVLEGVRWVEEEASAP